MKSRQLKQSDMCDSPLKNPLICQIHSQVYWYFRYSVCALRKMIKIYNEVKHR